MREHLPIFERNSEELVDNPGSLCSIINEFLESSVNSDKKVYDVITYKSRRRGLQFKDIIAYRLSCAMTNLFKKLRTNLSNDWIEKAFHISRNSYETNMKYKHKKYYPESDVITHSADNAYILAKELSYRTGSKDWVEAWVYYYNKTNAGSSNMKEYSLASKRYFDIYRETQDISCLFKAHKLMNKVISQDFNIMSRAEEKPDYEIWVKSHTDLLIKIQTELSKRTGKDYKYYKNNYETAKKASELLKEQKLKEQLKKTSEYFKKRCTSLKW